MNNDRIDELARADMLKRRIIAEHNKCMTELLARRNIRNLKFDVIKLTEIELRNALIDKQCNPDGDIDILRDRLLRAFLKEDDRYRHLVPWYEFDESFYTRENQTDNNTELASMRDNLLALAAAPEDDRSSQVYQNLIELQNQDGIHIEADDTAIREREYREMRRSLSVPSVHSTVGPPVAVVTTTSTSSATMPVMSTSAIGRPYSQGINANARINTERPINWSSISAQYRSERRIILPTERRNSSVDATNFVQRENNEQTWQTPKPRRSFIDPANELPADDESLITRSAAQSSSSSNQDYKTPGRFGDIENQLCSPSRRQLGGSRIPISTQRQIRTPERETRQPEEDEEESSGSIAQYTYDMRSPRLNFERRERQSSRTRQTAPTTDRAPASRRRVNDTTDDTQESDDGWSIVQGRKRRRTKRRRTENNCHRNAEYDREQYNNRRSGYRTDGQRTPDHRDARRQISYRDELLPTPKRYDNNSQNHRHRNDRFNREDDPYAPSIIWSSSSRASPTKPMAVKHLKSWNLKFSGSTNEDAEEFLERLTECVESTDIPVIDILRALPCVILEHAARWYRTIKNDVYTWENFERAFRSRFLKRYDREDLLADLRQRTQGKGEKIAAYLTNFRYIITRFARPPPEHELARIAYRNLHPEYRKAMSDKIIETFSDIEYYGQLWEEQKELDSRYSPPPAADKMRVKGAAFEPSLKAKVAAADTEGDDVCAIASSQPKNGKIGKQQNKQQTIPHQTATPKQTTAEVASY